MIDEGVTGSSQKTDHKIQSAKGGTLDGTLDGTLAQLIVEAIKKNPFITIDQLSEKTSIARRTLTRYVNLLQSTKYIQRIGGKRFGHWKITIDVEQPETTGTAQQELGNIEESVQKSVEKTQQKTSHKTSHKILNLILQNPNITTQEMADNIGVDRRNITRNIKKLVEGGFIKRVGSDKTGHWEVIPQK